MYTDGRVLFAVHVAGTDPYTFTHTYTFTQTVKSSLSVSQAFKAVEEAFGMLADGKVDVPQVRAFFEAMVWIACACVGVGVGGST